MADIYTDQNKKRNIKCAAPSGLATQNILTFSHHMKNESTASVIFCHDLSFVLTFKRRQKTRVHNNVPRTNSERSNLNSTFLKRYLKMMVTRCLDILPEF